MSVLGSTLTLDSFICPEMQIYFRDGLRAASRPGCLSGSSLNVQQEHRGGLFWALKSQHRFYLWVMFSREPLLTL